MTIEEIHVRRIEHGIASLRLRTRRPDQTQAPASLNALKSINLGLYEELLEKYKRVLEDYKKNTK